MKPGGTLLVVGAGGMLGSHLCDAAVVRGMDCIAASSRAGAARPFDLLRDDPERWLDASPALPDAVLVCAAQSNIDACRRDPQASRELNVVATGRLFRALARRNIHTVFYSSDMVFAGDSGNYGEDDACAPTTEYGRQKLEAENTLRDSGAPHLIIRLGKLYACDARDTSPLSGWYRAWSAGQSVRCARDQWLMPTWAGDVAAVSLELVAQRRSGIVHLVAPQAYTRLELARLLAHEWGFGAGLIEPCGIGDFDFAEPRPLNNCLRGERLRNWTGWVFRPVSRLRYDFPSPTGS